jgi:probable rRNA maturation factor
VSTQFVGGFGRVVLAILYFSTMPIYFHQADTVNPLKQRNALKVFIEKNVKALSGKQIELSIVFCSDKYLLKVNQDFLQHDYYTDIITFPLSNTKEQIEAEIYISIDRVKDNAKHLGVSNNSELHRVIFHGVLHLLGFKDKTKAQQLEMRQKEDEWLNKYGIIN